jgi:hypothetical protein
LTETHIQPVLPDLTDSEHAIGAKRRKRTLAVWVQPSAADRLRAPVVVPPRWSNRLGHSSAKTTLDIYGHLFPDEEDRTRRALKEAFADHEDEPPTDATSDAE